MTHEVYLTDLNSFCSVISAPVAVQSQFEHSTKVVVNVQWGLASISLCSWKNVF